MPHDPNKLILLILAYIHSISLSSFSDKSWITYCELVEWWWCFWTISSTKPLRLLFFFALSLPSTFIAFTYTFSLSYLDTELQPNSRYYWGRHESQPHRTPGQFAHIYTCFFCINTLHFRGWERSQRGFKIEGERKCCYTLNLERNPHAGPI